MAFFNTIRRIFGGGDKTVPKVRADVTMTAFDLGDPRLALLLRGGFIESQAGIVVTPELAMQVSTVYRCVALISGIISSLPLDVRRKVSATHREDASDHPVYTIMRKKPNSWQTPSEFRKQMQMSVLLRGNAYAYKVMTRGQTTALIPLNNGPMEIVQNADMTLDYTYTKLDGTRMKFSQDQIFHLRGMTWDGIRGASVLQSAREAMGLAAQSERHAATLFKNGASPGAVLTSKNELSADQIEAVKARLEDYRGAENAHKTLVLTDEMDFKPIGMTSVDMQFIQMRELTQTEIAMFFGVPPHMLGLTEKTTSWGAGIEQMSLGFVAYTLSDWMTMWNETIGRDLLTGRNDDNVYAKINPIGLLRGDVKTRYEMYATARQWGILSVNEIRSFEDMDPVPGDAGDLFLQPVNMVEAGAPPPPVAANPGGPPAAAPPPGDKSNA